MSRRNPGTHREARVCLVSAQVLAASRYRVVSGYCGDVLGCSCQEQGWLCLGWALGFSGPRRTARARVDGA